MVEATLTQENLGELHGRLSRCFARVEPLQQARKYVTGLMSDLPRKNSWTLAEHAGDRTPDRMQRLLNDAVWDTTTAMGVIRRFVAEHLAPPAGGNPVTRRRADTIAATHLAADRHWQTMTVPGSKGERSYAWAWVGTTSPQHFLLIRRHHLTGELAYHYCYVPPGRPVTLATLVAVACLRWPVEEDFEFGKDHFGLDHSQVRRYTALLRHTVLAMAALAVCAVTAAAAATRHRPPAPLPTRPDQPPPPDPGLIPLTVAEIKRLFNLITRRHLPEEHHRRWGIWRRRHQARARWFHHRARLQRQTS